MNHLDQLHRAASAQKEVRHADRLTIGSETEMFAPSGYARPGGAWFSSAGDSPPQ